MGRRHNQSVAVVDPDTGIASVPAEFSAPPPDGDTPAAPVESKAMKFKRLGNHRLPAALKRIRALQNLSNRAQYEYTDEQAGKIIEALSTAVVAVQQAFEGRKADEMPWIL